MEEDLRGWLDAVEKMGQLRKVDGADWDLEIGTLTNLNAPNRKGPALLFDKIKDHKEGFRVLTNSTCTPERAAHTVSLPHGLSGLQLVRALWQKLAAVEKELDKYPAKTVKTGPILENVQKGKDVDVFVFPTPKWHPLDGGRYIGTGDAVITRDPDSGEINVGTYRMMVQNKNTIGLFFGPGQHGFFHTSKYHAKNEKAPVCISYGHHPLLFGVACVEMPPGSEYSFAGAVRGAPMKVIKEELTGLPIPADSEIVVAGWIPKDRAMDEGPFGEWTGYYASKAVPRKVVEVERVYYRNNPILLGSPPNRPPSDASFFKELMRSALLCNELTKMGIPDISGVQVSEIGGRQWATIAIKQRYAGHAKQAAVLLSQSRLTAVQGRYVIVVDDDIDPTNTQEVLWAMCTRSDPEKDIDILRRAPSAPLDPIIRRPVNVFFNSRAIIDACKPFEWFSDFPQEIKISPELEKRVKEKFGKQLDL